MAADFVGLPPAYSFVADSEPFYAETVRYFDSLRAAGVPAKLDVYHTNMHAFDMMRPHDAQSIAAAEKFERRRCAGVLFRAAGKRWAYREKAR